MTIFYSYETEPVYVTFLKELHADTLEEAEDMFSNGAGKYLGYVLGDNIGDVFPDVEFKSTLPAKMVRE
jgi:hypothetical protein